MGGSIQGVGKVTDRLTCETKSGSHCRNRSRYHISRISREVTRGTDRTSTSATSSGRCWGYRTLNCPARITGNDIIRITCSSGACRIDSETSRLVGIRVRAAVRGRVSDYTGRIRIGRRRWRWCRNWRTRRTTSGAWLSILSSEITLLTPRVHYAISTPRNIEILTLYMMEAGRCSRKKRPRTRDNTDGRGQIGYPSDDGFYSVGIVPGIAGERMISSAH